MTSNGNSAGRSPGGPGTAVFAGGGAWWPRGQQAERDHAPDPTLVLTQPKRVLVAHSAAEVGALLAAVDEEQSRGNYVAGYLAYEAGAAFGLATKTDRSLTRPNDATSGRAASGSAAPSGADWAGSPGGELVPGSVPLAWMGVYPPANALSIDRPGQSAALRSSAQAGRETGPSEPILDVTFEEYVAAIACVREFIAAGDTYQANYTVRARFDLRQDPLAYFLERSLSHPVPYAAYLDLGPAQVISLSPELFLRRRGDALESRPMKGTRPRGTTVAADIDLAYELIGSEKDRAEDLMIVDMVRNDLGRVSRPGTVTVPALFTVEPYGTVWQMSSTVMGRLLPEAGVATIMAATFPGASITGAPKHHTMEIIRDLEAEPRGVYTGFVGLFLPGGDFTCNLCIRTLIHREGRCLLGVGSGVVWDSDAAEEYEETLTKAAFAFPARPEARRGEPHRGRCARRGARAVRDRAAGGRGPRSAGPRSAGPGSPGPRSDGPRTAGPLPLPGRAHGAPGLLSAGLRPAGGSRGGTGPVGRSCRR